ncbi:uncharacterized protein [Musca autumnalis]|uniref:uncharacterized protein n=1 Tax=Musca autumnalis TaxID=221902 RepID=UPI003CFB4156
MFGCKYLMISLLLSIVITQINCHNRHEHTSHFIETNKHHYDDFIKECDFKLDAFGKMYTARLGTIDIQKEFLLKSIQQSSDRLMGLELLSDVNKKCSEKYKSAFPEVAAIKTIIQNCTDNGLEQLPSLLAPLQETRDKLFVYYNQTLEDGILNCNNLRTSNMGNFNHTDCIKNVTFDYQMNSAQCSADTYIKMALDCSYVAQTTVVSLITATNVFIDRCAKNVDCVPCEGFQCENVYNIPPNAVDYTNQTMVNPFYGINQTLSCLMINVV